jgi:L-ascorbate metabolism protein UlaG (beta-lactamase superfamily)
MSRFLVPFALVCTVAAAAPALEVTLIANEGFLISSGSNKVRIDSLMLPHTMQYNTPSDELRDRIERGEGPFKGLKAVLVTHSHADHFTAKPVAEFLSHNPGAIFLSTRTAVEAVCVLAPKSQFRVVTPEKMRAVKTEQIGKIRVDSLWFTHGRPDFENLAFLIRMNGFTVLHTGDSMDPEDYEAYPWEPGGVDVALVNCGLVRGQRFVEVLKNRIKPRTVVLMHYPLNELAETQALAAGLKERFERVVALTAPLESVTVKK